MKSKISISAYVKERDEMLLRCDINELRKFVNKNKGLYTKQFVKAFNKASDEVVKITLHKMIVSCTNLPFDFRQKSADWLLDRGFSLDIN